MSFTSNLFNLTDVYVYGQFYLLPFCNIIIQLGTLEEIDIHILGGMQMQGQLNMLNFVCTDKARPRIVTINRGDWKEEDLEFTLIGGCHQGIFVDSVIKNSNAYKNGLKRGDQILKVNGENFQHGMTVEKALEFLKKAYLQIDVKSNFSVYKEVISTNSDLKSKPRLVSISDGVDAQSIGKSGVLSMFGRKKKKVVEDKEKGSTVRNGGPDDVEDAIPELSLKIFKADHMHCFILVHKNVTASEIVKLSLKEFGIADCSERYALYEVSVADSGFKTSLMPDGLPNLAQRIRLGTRYYIKIVSHQLSLEEISGELLKESNVSLLDLDVSETATQLMVEDYKIFQQIEQTEYVDHIFEIKSTFGKENLDKFSELMNKETLWVVSELVQENNMIKRSKMVKRFIQISKQCREIQNFNSMFAIVQGLYHPAVKRLKQTWERVPEKYSKLLKDLNDIMDPSRNFSRYRNLIKSDMVKPPLIPIYPMVSKDFAFVDIGNKTRVEGLINFEKMRLVANLCRSLTAMCSVPLKIAMNEGEQPGKFGTMRKGGAGARVVLDAKKMYHDALMVRTVKTYLESLNNKIIVDETVLQSMSREVEPPA